MVKMPTRISVSLKFDSESKFFTEFVCVKRENKELSEFIVSLLEAYYHHAEVRDVFIKYTNEVDTFAELKSQFERIVQEHSKNIQSTVLLHEYLNDSSRQFYGEESVAKAGYAMSDFVNQDAQDKVVKMLKGEVESSSGGNDLALIPSSNNVDFKDSELIERVENLEKLIPLISGLESKLDAILNRVSTAKEESISSNTENTGNTNNSIIVESISQTTGEVREVEQSVEKPIEKSVSLQETENNVSDNVIKIPVNSAEPIKDSSVESISAKNIGIEETVQEVEEVRPSKPASFSRLAKSLSR